jgi:hypothetical protein
MHHLLIFSESILCGPVHNEKAVELFKTTLEDVNASGGKITVGGKVNDIFKLTLFILDSSVSSTHAKISHLLTSLSTSRQQDVFALLVTSCQQVWNNLVEIIKFVARLF